MARWEGDVDTDRDLVVCDGLFEGTLDLEQLVVSHAQEAWIYCEKTRDPAKADWDVVCETPRGGDWICHRVSGPVQTLLASAHLVPGFWSVPSGGVLQRG